MKNPAIFGTLFSLSTLILSLPPICATPDIPPSVDFHLLSQSIKQTLSDRVYHPAALRDRACSAFFEELDQVGATARTRREFEAGFQHAASTLPFSHLELRRSNADLPAMLTALDEMRVGPKAVRLENDGDIAILTVNTMMGRDTIEAIEAAYSEIAQTQPAALLIDLRDNQGGAFAIISLVEHLIAEPVDAGWFVGRGWWHSHTAPPTLTDLATVPPWQGNSLKEFWRVLTEQDLVRVQFHPRANPYSGPVHVLISRKSASATEIAVAALKSAGRITLIGETTAGHVLSQLPQDVGQGYFLSVPIGDYYSSTLGRLENRGIVPDIACEPTDALKVARQLTTRN